MFPCLQGPGHYKGKEQIVKDALNQMLKETWPTKIYQVPRHSGSSICKYIQYNEIIFVAVIQSLSHVQLFVTLWTAACQASPSFTISWSLLKLMSIESVMPSYHLFLCHTLSPVFNLCHHQDLFQWVCSSHQVTKVLELQLQQQSFQWIFISFRIDWFDFLTVQGTLKSLFQHHSSKASILQCSAFLWSNSHIHTYLLE